MSRAVSSFSRQVPLCAKIMRRQLSMSKRDLVNINNVTVIGSGIMGGGIAQVAAQYQCSVVMVDVNEDILKRSMKAIKKSLDRLAKKNFPDDQMGQDSFVSAALGNLRTETDAGAAVAKADLLVEAIVENVAAKQALFDHLEPLCPPHTLFATNTSSLRLKDIAQRVERKDKFGCLHFFNPVPMMKLLEVVRHDDTSDESFEAFMNFGKRLGKVTVACRDTPGFIVNRLLVPYMMESIRMVERGDSSMRDVDMAMKYGAGYPMGPFELADYVGLDTTKFIMDGWYEQYPESHLFKPSNLLNKLVAEGKFGRKNGQGFYTY